MKVDFHLVMNLNRLVKLPSQYNDMLDTRGIDNCFLDNVLERNRFSTPESNIGSDYYFCFSTIYPAVQCRSPKPAENDTVNCPDTCTRKHRDDLLGYHG